MSDTELLALARKGIEIALEQCAADGAPLDPFLLDESMYGCGLGNKDGGDPVALAQAAIPVQLPSVGRCVLLLDTQFDFRDGKRANAIVAMACNRDGGEGVVLAQRYLPKRWFRRFRPVGDAEPAGSCANFVRAAFADGAPAGASKFLEREEAELERKARNIIAAFDALRTPVHRIREVSSAEFEHLDQAFYDATLSVLADAGFCHLADVEDETISDSPGNSMLPTLIRLMRSADGNVVGIAAEMKPKTAALALMATARSLVEFETEFDDGVFIATSSAAQTPITHPPGVRVQFRPELTAPLELLAAHRESVSAYAAATGAAPRPALDYASQLAGWHRLNAIKAAYREEVGVVTLDELRQFSRGDLRLASRMHEKIAQLLARD